MKHVPRIFINENLKFNKVFVLDVFDTNHVLHVLKKKDGDEVIIFNDSEEWSGTLSIIKRVCSVRLQKFLRKQIKKNFKLTVYLSLFKRFDFAIEKLIEVGVDAVIPVVTDFSCGFVFNKQKINKIIKGALEQSNRFGDFIISDQVNLFDIKFEEDMTYFACVERESCDNLLRKVINDDYKNKDLAILIGPEGGFSAREIEFIKNSNFIPISLGDNILRAETAAIAASFVLRNII